MWLAVVVVVLAGCGRLDFDPDSEQPPRFISPSVVYYGSTYDPEVDLEAFIASQGRSSGRVSEASPLDATVLADADLVVVQALFKGHTIDEAAALASWVELGGSVVVLGGYDINGDAARINSVVSALGVDLVGNLVDGPITEFAPHPTTADVHLLTFMGGYELQVSNAFTTTATLAGAPVGAVASIGRGRVVIWGDEWVAKDSQWIHPDEQAFWANVLDWTCHRTN